MKSQVKFSFAIKILVGNQKIKVERIPLSRATSLSTYDFSTLYTTLPHNQIKQILID